MTATLQSVLESIDAMQQTAADKQRELDEALSSLADLQCQADSLNRQREDQSPQLQTPRAMARLVIHHRARGMDATEHSQEQ